MKCPHCESELVKIGQHNYYPKISELNIFPDDKGDLLTCKNENCKYKNKKGREYCFLTNLIDYSK